MDERNKNDNKGRGENGMKRFMRRRGIKLKHAVSAVYLGIALCMVVVLAVSFSSTKDAVKDSIGKLDDISISLPDISLPDISTPQPSISNPPAGDEISVDKPVGSTQSGVTDTVVPPETVVPKYMHPVSGKLLKGHSTDTLVFSETMQDYRIHKGIDIAAEIGTSVCAYTDGKVISVEELPFMGVTVEIEHEAGVRSVYSNLASEVVVAAGDTVVAGDIIGKVGDSALIEAADEPHLHFEIWMEEDCLNPLDQFPE